MLAPLTFTSAFRGYLPAKGPQDAVESAEVDGQDGAVDSAVDMVRFMGNYWENHNGLGKRWLQSDRGWLIVLPNGEVHTATRTASASTRLATLDASYFSEPTRLFDAPDVPVDPAGSTVALGGSQITVDPADGFTGTLALKVTAKAGQHTIEKIVLIRVITALDPQDIAAAFAAGILD
jgi:hypothetical protein